MPEPATHFGGKRFEGTPAGPRGFFYRPPAADFEVAGRLARSHRESTMSNNIDYEADQLARKVSDTARSTSATAQRKIGGAAGYVSEAAMRVSTQAKDLYGEVTGRARKVAQTVDPYVKGQPYATMGLAAAAGLLLGLMMAGHGPKVIYVEPKS
jgi:ElaB/YqjD/DUF883 family membrane-anchored ribosome-binding protein